MLKSWPPHSVRALCLLVHQLLTRRRIRTAGATIGTVTRDRVVGKCIDLSTGGDQHAVAGVEIDEILTDFNH